MSDHDPMLLTRAHPKAEIQDDFDDWQRQKHLPDLMRAPGATMVVSLATCSTGCPRPTRAPARASPTTRRRRSTSSSHSSRARRSRRRWRTAPRWFGRFNDVDYETYTGNVYEVTGVVNAGGGAPAETSPLLVERWEPAAGDEAEFDVWLLGSHLPELGAAPGVRRARAFSAIREGIPIPYYYSPGSRALVAELDDDFRSVLLSPGLLARLEDSMRWERRLPYVKRDVYEHVAHARAER